MFAEEKPSLAAAAARAVPLLPVRRADGASGWLRRSRSRLLQRAAGLDRPQRQSAVGCAARPAARSAAPVSCCASTCARSAAGIASTTKTARSKRRSAPRSCWRAPHEPDRTSARSAKRCIASKGETGIRRILGVLSLAKKYGVAAVDDACAAALELGVHEYRFVRRYLERQPATR